MIIGNEKPELKSAVFITFSGSCRKALTFYQTIFGGKLQLENFEGELNGYPEAPVIRGSLVSDRIIMHGSDLVHNEGRKIGNYISIFLPCKNLADREYLINKLKSNKPAPAKGDQEQKLIEVTDDFDVRWILSI